jgi:hypothetical protein
MPRPAREHIRVARRLSELPRIHAAFRAAELSYAKVRALTRVADADTEEELLELASYMTAAQLDRAVRAYRRITNTEANDLHANAHFGWYWDEDGSLVVHGRLAPEDGALFLRAIEAGRDRLRERRWEEERGSAEPRDVARRPTNAEALVEIADASLASPGERSSAERNQVVIHASAAALSADEEGGCALEEGPALAPETARRLACDASVLNKGRKTRVVPAPMQRALRARDRGCRFPGCENRRFVDAHHIHHWAKGGETKLDNLVLLCRRHHRFVHEGGYSVDEAFCFRDSWGSVVPDVPRSPPGDAAGLLETDVGEYEPSWVDPMDLDIAVLALRQVLG